MTRKHPEIMAQNPLRLLKRGFSTYTPEDTALLAQDGKQPRFDIERDRRLEEGEEAAILKMFEEGSEERLFFILALETAMRMRECYTLYVDQVNLQKRTIHLERSKNGETRQVPLSSVAREVLDSFIREHQAEIAARDGRLFSFWNGDLAIRNLDRTTADVSRRFRIAFTDAGVQGLTFHDLRHEATCRLFERTTLSVVVNKDVASSHAAFLNCSGGFRSGFSQTSSFNSQSRVAPLQRSGWRCFAAS
ncbi:hypothetical protein HMPREF9710_02474 [Massilia timonae CCUG 45783]|uniref:Tyr recombinase domain-containing protein n=1 Tax=Massilia timonae CCUG 45783 TaxID=883126 RepID=K9DD29_9BURK|nr:hypothetical protein HMPREF9710_02474 [Massilia timonae CCUG 45783]